MFARWKNKVLKEEKMSNKFDKQQQAVLDCSSLKQLVSASAGSGKTTVMIRKIADLLINDTAKPNELLVVTFTNLASTEMKQRLSAVLTETLISAEESKKSHYQELLDSIDTASVDTIDGFCSKMLKKYFYKANLDPEIKIISSFSQEYYINKALDLAISKYNTSHPTELVILCDIFEKKNRNLDNLKQSLLSSFNFCICQKDYHTFLNNILHQYDDFNSPCANYLNNYIISKTLKHREQISRLLPKFTDFPKLHKSLDEFICALNVDNCKNLMDTVEILQSAPICNFSKTERVVADDFDYANVKFNVEKLKKLINEISFLIALKDVKELPKVCSHLSCFVELLNTFIQCYTSLKEDNNVMDFADLERKMLELLKNEEIIADFHSTYKYIFVDEYQDINPMQDELINTLLANTSSLFLVGDVKQSIYGFRQSTPELFIDTYKKFKQNEQLGSAFDMNINFRSAPKILNFNNEIFCKLMNEQDSGIDYDKTSKFEPKREDFPDDKAVEILISSTDSESISPVSKGIYRLTQHINPPETMNAEQLEASIVLDKICSLVGTEFYDSSTKQTRVLEYRDIAILSRNINNQQVKNLATLLTSKGIPINISRRTNIKDCEALAKIISILRILNFTANDIDYTSFFTSPLVKLSYNDLLKVYADHSVELYSNLQTYMLNNNDEISTKIKKGFDLCRDLQYASTTLSINELIDLILNKYHLRQHIIASVKGFDQINILDEFLASLSSEEKNLSITKFIDFIERNISSNNDVVSRDSMNSVTIQTIHASKGLEYPIVILFNSGHQFNYITEHSDLNFDQEFGIGMQYFDLLNRKRYESVVRYTIGLKNKEKAYREELRLLYVATTRAKNKLIITGCCSEDKLKSNSLSMDNYLALILSCYYSKINTQPLLAEYDFANCSINILYELASRQVDNSAKLQALADDKIVKRNINFTYPYLEETNISLKNNVTALSKTINEEYNISPIKLNLSENLQAVPDDLAQIGTAYHSALAEIDYNMPYTSKQYDGLDQSLIKLAYDKISPIAKGCVNQFTEKQFLMSIPYNEIFKSSPINTKMIVQGVVDLIFEFDDHIELIDYKYSSSTIGNLVKRYRTQILLYKIALEKAFKKPVTKSYIYSIKTGELG